MTSVEFAKEVAVALAAEARKDAKQARTAEGAISKSYFGGLALGGFCAAHQVLIKANVPYAESVALIGDHIEFRKLLNQEGAAL